MFRSTTNSRKWFEMWTSNDSWPFAMLLLEICLLGDALKLRKNVSISSIHVEIEICFPAIERIRLINFQSEELGARSQEAAASLQQDRCAEIAKIHMEQSSSSNQSDCENDDERSGAGLCKGARWFMNFLLSPAITARRPAIANDSTLCNVTRERFQFAQKDVIIIMLIATLYRRLLSLPRRWLRSHKHKSRDFMLSNAIHHF